MQATLLYWGHGAPLRQRAIFMPFRNAPPHPVIQLGWPCTAGKTSPRNVSQSVRVSSPLHMGVCVWCDHLSVTVVTSVVPANDVGLDVCGDSFKGTVA